MAKHKRYYTDLNFVDDICKLLLRRIKTLIAESKKEGMRYLEIDYDTLLGTTMDYLIVRDKLAAHLGSKGYKVTYGITTDKMVINW